MGTWGDLLKELEESRTASGAADYDGIRRKYLRQLAEYTKRNVIVYETAGFSPPQGAVPADLFISLDPDMAAFMETVHGLHKDVGLDLILHSPGGTAEAAEGIVKYLRGRFPELRVIVPVAAMSAASMMAMAADQIVLAAHSQLGPIDPQISIQTPEGPRSAPAAAIVRQFGEAQSDLAKNPQHTAAWLPILRSLAPALLQVCEDAAVLSRSMVAEWLEKWMFVGNDDAAQRASDIADVLADYDRFKSHSRGIDRDAALHDLGLNILDLEDDQRLQDLVLSVHHAVSHTMDKTGTVKLVENQDGKAWIRRVGTIQVPVQLQGPKPAIPGGPDLVAGIPGALPQGNRQQRRAAQSKKRKGK